METPTNKKELQTFLGFVNFYHKFIKDFAKMSRKLTHLTGKIPWVWTEEQTIAFEQLKAKVTMEPILHLAQDEVNSKWKLTGSGLAMGAVLMQNQQDQWKTVAYHSKTFQEAE